MLAFFEVQHRRSTRGPLQSPVTLRYHHALLVDLHKSRENKNAVVACEGQPPLQRLNTQNANRIRSMGIQRSGIKEEQTAIGRRG